MRLLTSSVVLIGAVIVTGAPAVAMRGPQIGWNQRAIDTTWQRDKMPCIGGICTYRAMYQQPLTIYVLYRHNGAEAFEVGFNPERFSGNGPSPAGNAYWRLLTNLLPTGAKRTGCRYIRKTGGAEGPANACLYRTRQGQALVAQYLSPNAVLGIGTTALHRGYDWIEAAH